VKTVVMMWRVLCSPGSTRAIHPYRDVPADWDADHI